MLITKANNTDLSTIVILGNEALGKGYLTESYLGDFIDSKNKNIYVAKENNQTIGFITCSQVPKTEYNKILLTQDESIVLKMNAFKQITFIHQLVIHPNYQRRKLGTRFLSVIKENITHNSDAIFAICWYKGENTPLINLIQKQAFYRLGKIENYWYEDSKIKQFICPICGTPPCKCPAEIYAFSLL